MDENHSPENPDRDTTPHHDADAAGGSARASGEPTTPLTSASPARPTSPATPLAPASSGTPGTPGASGPSGAPGSAGYGWAVPAAPGGAAAKPPVWRRRPVWITAVAVVGVLALGGAGLAYVLDERDDDRRWATDDDRRGGAHEDYRDSDDRRELVDDRDDRRDEDRLGSDGYRDADDVPLTDAEIAAVTEAALAEAGGGTVTDVDRSDDRSHAFEVDVRLENGDELEVGLDESYVVVWTQLDPADRG